MFLKWALRFARLLRTLVRYRPLGGPNGGRTDGPTAPNPALHCRDRHRSRVPPVGARDRRGARAGVKLDRALTHPGPSEEGVLESRCDETAGDRIALRPRYRASARARPSAI